MSANRFVWYDLMTPDIKSAESFYKSILGWGSMDAGFSDRKYTLMLQGETMVAGLMETPPEVLAMGVPPMWNGHIGVDDVDGFAARVVAAGGHLHRPPEDIPNGIGRFAVVSDPGGASFILFKGAGEQPAPPPAGTPGYVGWHELHAANGEAAWEFYSGLFGWTKAEAVDMGPAGIYHTFAIGGFPVGGMMTKMPEMPVPRWLYYFNVDAVDSAIERVKAAGGSIVMGPHEVPGGSWIAQGVDPQGGTFAVVSLTR
jgi:predicted enzyme related to lactoylglutathione lyase